MRYCRFGDDAYGLVRAGLVHDITPIVESVIGVAGGDRCGDPFVAHLAEIAAAVTGAKLDDGVPAGSVRLLSPVRRPGKIVAAPVNYATHAREAAGDSAINRGRPVPAIDDAGLFLKAPTSLVGAGEGIALRFPERRTDHEVEVGVVLGAQCTRVPAANAAAAVAGYSIALDITLRGSEDRSFRKSIDTYSVLGPYLVTPDEVPDPGELRFALSVNGEVRQQSNTRYLIRDIASLIAWASEWYTLLPGDILMTGTPDGVGPIAPGDVLEAVAGPLGSMRVKVRSAGDEQPHAPLRSPPRLDEHRSCVIREWPGSGATR